MVSKSQGRVLRAQGVNMSMYNFLFVIFVSYVLYGLSGNLLNSVWPKVAGDIGAAVALLGIVSTLCNITSGVTSAFVYKIRRKYGTNVTVSIGLVFMALSLILYGVATNIYVIGAGFIMLGVGNAIVDVGANSYVIKAYDAKKVSLLHACWGIGSSIGPMIMALSITFLNDYRAGFAIGATIIIVVFILMRFMKRKWEANKEKVAKEVVDLHSVSQEEKTSTKTFADIVKIDLALIVMICFFFGNAFNGLMNTWIATIYVEQRHLTVIEGANLATVFFASLTITRIVLGFIGSNIKTKNVILFGIILSIIGIGIMFFKSTNMNFLYLNVAILGIGIAPIIPFFNHYLKDLFGENNVGEILGYCSIFSLTGIGISSFCATLVVRFFGIDVIQIYIMVVVIILLAIFSYIVYRADKRAKI